MIAGNLCLDLVGIPGTSSKFSGGIFYYPVNINDKNRPNGKLRLLYEVNPLSYLVEQAGGAASDGHQSPLDIQPEHLHHRTPFFVGNRELVTQAENFIKQYG